MERIPSYRSEPCEEEVCEPREIKCEAILVAVRVRPLFSKDEQQGAKSCCESSEDSSIICIRKAAVANSFLSSQAEKVNEFAFDYVFSEWAPQHRVYQSTTQPYLPKLFEGFNVTILAYGTTSAGKTHTMFGPSNVLERSDAKASYATDFSEGIIPRSMRDILLQVEAKRKILQRGECWEVYLIYVEVYNEQVYDLLSPRDRTVLSLREDQTKGIVVIAGVTEQKIASVEEALAHIKRGNSKRQTDATAANEVSSRSHAVLQLIIRHTAALCLSAKKSVESEKGGNFDIVITEAKLSLVDLAGSERAGVITSTSMSPVKFSGGRAKRVNEGSNINKSLLALANCINALAENSNSRLKKKVNVKYRDSKLTLLLKNSLEGKSHLVMIANVNPSHLMFEDTLNTLKYANRAKNIKIAPIVAISRSTVRAFSEEHEAAWMMKQAQWNEERSRLLRENEALVARIADLEAQLEKSKQRSGLFGFVSSSMTNTTSRPGSPVSSISGAGSHQSGLTSVIKHAVSWISNHSGVSSRQSSCKADDARGHFTSKPETTQYATELRPKPSLLSSFTSFSSLPTRTDPSSSNVKTTRLSNPNVAIVAALPPESNDYVGIGPSRCSSAPQLFISNNGTQPPSVNIHNKRMVARQGELQVPPSVKDSHLLPLHQPVVKRDEDAVYFDNTGMQNKRYGAFRNQPDLTRIDNMQVDSEDSTEDNFWAQSRSERTPLVSSSDEETHEECTRTWRWMSDTSTQSISDSGKCRDNLVTTPAATDDDASFACHTAPSLFSEADNNIAEVTSSSVREVEATNHAKKGSVIAAVRELCGLEARVVDERDGSVDVVLGRVIGGIPCKEEIDGKNTKDGKDEDKKNGKGKVDREKYEQEKEMLSDFVKCDDDASSVILVQRQGSTAVRSSDDEDDHLLDDNQSGEENTEENDSDTSYEESVVCLQEHSSPSSLLDAHRPFQVVSSSELSPRRVAAEAKTKGNVSSADDAWLLPQLNPFNILDRIFVREEERALVPPVKNVSATVNALHRDATVMMENDLHTPRKDIRHCLPALTIEPSAECEVQDEDEVEFGVNESSARSLPPSSSPPWSELISSSSCSSPSSFSSLSSLRTTTSSSSTVDVPKRPSSPSSIMSSTTTKSSNGFHSEGSSPKFETRMERLDKVRKMMQSTSLLINASAPPTFTQRNDYDTNTSSPSGPYQDVYLRPQRTASSDGVALRSDKDKLSNATILKSTTGSRFKLHPFVVASPAASTPVLPNRGQPQQSPASATARGGSLDSPRRESFIPRLSPQAVSSVRHQIGIATSGDKKKHFFPDEDKPSEAISKQVSYRFSGQKSSLTSSGSLASTPASPAGIAYTPRFSSHHGDVLMDERRELEQKVASAATRLSRKSLAK